MSDHNGHTVNRTRLRNLGTYLLFVLLATIIWYGRALRATHDAKLSVSVEYTGIPGKVEWQDSLPRTIEATVRDAGTRLRFYHFQPLHISVDLNGQFERNSGTVTISPNQLRTLVTNALQGTSRLQDLKPERLEAHYSTQKHKTVPVRLSHAIRCAAEYQMVDSPQVVPSSVTVYGSGTALDTIHHIDTRLLEVSDLKDSASHRVALVAPRGVRLSRAYVDVNMVASRYTERIIPATIQVEGAPEGKHIRLFPQKADVTLLIRIDRWDKVSDSDVVVFCRYDTAQVQDKLPVQLRYDNPGIGGARVYPSAVEFMIENQQ